MVTVVDVVIAHAQAWTERIFTRKSWQSIEAKARPTK
jgi:hypothetical protein